MKSQKQKLIEAINEHGAALVYPINNQHEPINFWHILYPRSYMRWEWDDDGDNRVADLWHMRQELSRSGKVVYSKWYQGRATFFSREVFVHLLAALETSRRPVPELKAAREILSILEDNSPLSTKVLKKATDLVGKDMEPTYTKALKELFQKGYAVAWGEFDDGAFPSLGIGAASLLFEDLWRESKEIDPKQAKVFLIQKLGTQSPFTSFLYKVLKPSEPKNRAQKLL